MTPGNFEQFLPRLSSFGVRYILIGGGAGRPKDFEVIAELEALQQEPNQHPAS